MVVSDASIHNIMGGMESTAGVRLHNHRRKLKQRFDIIKKLGQGTYGKVQLGINKETGQEVAIKTIKKAKIETEADLVRIRREIQIMSSVQHPNIIHIYEVFENREKMVLVMEYAAGGELYDFLNERKVLAEEEARRIFRQIAIAVYYCHKHKICHRDLKLENILLDEHGSAKIADFGLSNVFDEQRLLSTFCGSPLYASPEIVKGTPYHGPEVDCWSLGVLLYTLVYGAMPFDGSNFKRLVKQISQGDYFEPKKPSPASSLIREMLTVTPARRADIEKICSHWWVNEGHSDSCLDIAEDLANQTPVRLDLLLSLAPPPPAVGSDKMLLTNEQESEESRSAGPPRCHSVGSLMELDHPASERRLRELETGSKKEEALKDAPKRKLEEGVSTEDAARGGVKKKERSKSTAKSDTEVDKNRMSIKEEKMEVDVAESQTAPAKKEPHEPPAEVTPTDVAESCKAEPSTEKELSRESSTRRSLKGSTTKVKPTSPPDVNSVSVEKSPSIKEAEIEIKTTETKEEVVIAEAAADTPKPKEASDESITETVKPKVKKKKKVVSSVSKTEEVPTDAPQKPEANSQPTAEVDTTSQVTKPTETSDTSTPSSTSKDSSAVPKTPSIKTKKSRADLSLGKLTSSTDKPETEDLASPTKPMERRRSKIFENADKFNIFLTGSEPKSPTTEKPKKMFIPGVKVSDYKAAFERRSSVTSAVPSPSKTSVPKKAAEQSTKSVPAVATSTCDNETNDMSKAGTEKSSKVPDLPKRQDDLSTSVKSDTVTEETKKSEEAAAVSEKAKDEETELKLIPALPITDKVLQQDEAKIKKLKDAVDVISNAIAEESKKDSDPKLAKKVPSGKPPFPSPGDRTKVKSVVNSASSISKSSPPTSPAEKKPAQVQGDSKLTSGSQSTKFPFEEAAALPSSNGDVGNKVAESTPLQPTDTVPAKKSAKVEITLKSATLPRRKTSKAEIQLGYPPVTKPAEVGAAGGEYRTEVEHMVGTVTPRRLQNQRSEVAFPVAAAVKVQPLTFRSSSLEPEGTPSSKQKPREHIIPIQVERDNIPPSPKPPVPLMQQRSMSQRSSSLSRQSTQDSDTDSTISVSGPEPIRKSPREFIIPIAVEGGGYVTPRAGSVDSTVSESADSSRQRHSIGHHKKTSSLLSDNGASEDEGFNGLNSPFATLHRQREGDDDFHHMHRLRSSRPSRRPVLDHNDSLSSAEEEDDDDGFEILTAESLFSTLLSRVRSLTQRLNVEDGGRPGFPPSRLMSHLTSTGSPSSSFWNNMYPEPLSRRISESSQFSRSFGHEGDGPAPWRRSASRDASESDSVYSDTSSVPRGAARFDIGDDGLSNYYTPGLAKRMHRHLYSSKEDLNPPVRKSSLGSIISPPQASRHLARTLSLRAASEAHNSNDGYDRSLKKELSHPARRSLSLLDSKETSVQVGSADNRARVLPPLPSQIRKRDSPLYARQRTMDVNSYSLQHPKIQEEIISDRPHHSSSLPSLAKGKEKKTVLPDVPINKSTNSSSIERSYSAARGKPTEKSNNSAETKSRSHIPSLLKFRSSSVSCDLEKQKKTEKSIKTDKPDDSIRRRSCSSTCSTPDRSILSKFFRQGSEEREVAQKTDSVNGEKKTQRRISRFLRPDFYDTPREDSVYAKEKDAKKAKEAENKLKQRKSESSAIMTEASRVPKLISDKIKSSRNSLVFGGSSSSLAVNTNSLGDINTSLGSTVESVRNMPSSTTNFENRKENENVTPSKTLKSLETKIPTGEITKKLGMTVENIKIPGQSENALIEEKKKNNNNENMKKSSKILSGAEITKKSESSSKLLDTSKKYISKKCESNLTSSKISKPVISNVGGMKKFASVTSIVEGSKPQDNSSCATRMKKCDSSSLISKRNEDVLKVSHSLVQAEAKELPKANLEKSEDQKNIKLNAKKLETTSGAFEKQTSPAPNRSKFLHSLEKKLEKFKLSGDDITSSNVSGKSRVDKAIRSLREQSLTPRGGDIVTSESHLLKRAVSVTDCCTVEPASKTQTSSSKEKLGNKVNSVLGLFKKLEDTKQSSALTRLRRTQSVYAGSQSDSVLDNVGTHPVSSLIDDKQDTVNFVQQDLANINSELPNLMQASVTPNEANNCAEDDLSLNDDEVKFTNIKHADSYANDLCTLSPADESESFDSWSVCSDFESREFPPSPIPLPGDDVEESVVDRIRRKSFYSRFNDIKKKHRKPSYGSLSSSYRDPCSNSYLHSYSRKKSNSGDYSYKKPHRSQSLYDTCNRTSQCFVGDSNGLIAEDPEVNGFDDSWDRKISTDTDHFGGSMEVLHMPRYFNQNVKLGSMPTRRASETHLCDLDTRSYASPSKYSSNSCGIPGRHDSVLSLGSVAGEGLPLHGKYKRYSSQRTLDTATRENLRMESARPTTPY